jgi:RimJ/RimL family protein N-acetyltransferase
MLTTRPAEWPDLQAHTTIATRDGRSVLVRHMRNDDAARLEAMFYRLSSETRWRRFFVPLDSVDPQRVRQEARRLATIDPRREVALVAIVPEQADDAVIAVARYSIFTNAPGSAEASIVVRDDYQGSGLGLQLFDLLTQVALAQNIRHMVLLTHADNRGMIALVQRLGLPFQGRHSAGLYEIDLQLAPNDRPFFPFSEG